MDDTTPPTAAARSTAGPTASARSSASEAPAAGAGADASTSTLVLELLPAKQGDALLLEYGDPQRPHRVLVDAGPARAYPAVRERLARLPEQQRHLELLVLTHVDGDHVEGAVPLLDDRELGLTYGDVWFNGYRHLTDDLGAVHGEIVSALLSERRLPWNEAFDRRAVRRDSGPTLPSHTLPGGLRLTVLAPVQDTLLRLRKVWEKECRKAGLTPGTPREALGAYDRRPALHPLDSYLSGAPDRLGQLAATRTGSDDSVANASSIVLLAEYAGRAVLLTGDAPGETVVEGLALLARERGVRRLPLDAVKLPHHGSSRNVTTPLVKRALAPRYLFSSDGSYFGHPDPEAVARVVVDGPPDATLVFNYRSEQTQRWADRGLREQYGYEVSLPPDETAPGVRCTV